MTFAVFVEYLRPTVMSAFEFNYNLDFKNTDFRQSPQLYEAIPAAVCGQDHNLQRRT